MSRISTAVRSVSGSAASACRSSATRSRCSSAAIGPGLVRRRRQLVRVDVAVDRLALLADAAVVIDAEVAADADQPGLEIRAPVERVERLEDLQEDVLRQILGFVVLADELVRDVEHLAPVLADDQLPGELIALQAALNQRFDGVGRRGADRQACGQTGMSGSSDDSDHVACRRPASLAADARARLRRRAARRRSPTAEGTPLYVYSAAHAARALSRDRRGVRRLSARAALRAQGQLDAGASRACCASSAAPPTPTRSGRSSVARRAGFAPRDIVFTGVGKSPAELECAVAARPEGHQRRIGRRAGAHRGDRRAAGARRRASRSASTRTSTRRAIRTSRRASRSTSSACRSTRRASCWRRCRAGRRCSWSRFTCTSARRSRRSSRCGARRRSSPASAAELQRGGRRARVRRSRRRPRHLLRRRRRCRRPPSTSAALVDEVRADAACRSSSSRAARSSAPAGALVARVIDVKPRTASSEFVVIDAGMTELMRPALYGAFHRIEPVRAARRRAAPVRDRRPGLREQRRRRPRSHAAAARGRRSRRDSRRRRVRVGDGVELQSPAAAGRGAGGRRRRGASSAAARRSTTCWRSRRA